MASTLGNILRLARAGIVLAQHGVRFVPAGTKVPLALHLARAATLPIRALTWPFRIGQPKERRVAGALTSLGPSYIKLGQFLATRADLIGPELARDLAHLQDRLPPFSMAEARSGGRGGARRQAGGSFRGVRTAGCGRLHRPGAQGRRDRQRRCAARWR